MITIPPERHVEDWQPGHRGIHALLALSASGKGCQVQYYGHVLWVPLKVIVQYPDGSHSVPAWAIDSAKEYADAKTS